MLPLKSLALATAFFLPVFASPLPTTESNTLAMTEARDVLCEVEPGRFLKRSENECTEAKTLAMTKTRDVLCEVEPGRFLKRSENEGPCISQEKALNGVLEHVEYA